MKSKKDPSLTRRDFLKAAVAASASLPLAGAALGAVKNDRTEKEQMNDTSEKEMLVYVGTYTSGKSRSEGIYIYKFNLATGALESYKTIKNVVEPSYLAISNNRKFLFAVNETTEYAGEKSGAVSAFAIDQQTGDLSFLNKQPSLGGAPCFATVSENDKFVLVANYAGGNASVFPVLPDGKLGAAVDMVQNSGTGANKKRQEAAHAHSINLDAENRFAYLCDLGVDKIFIYEFDSKTGKLSPNAAQPFYQTKAGVGPRHLAFDRTGKYVFFINELDSSITALARDEKSGTLKEIQTVPTVPADWTSTNYCADVHVSPDGNFLYGSNRGHDSIVVYKIDAQNGNLQLIEHVSTQGKTPRNFAIDPTGRFLLAANQNSDSIVVFRIDEKSGELSPTGNTAQVPKPVCLKFIPSFQS